MINEELSGGEQAAEEVIAPAEGEIQAPESGEGEKPADKPQTKTEIETLALEMGWDPKKAKTAADWIRDGTVIQRDLKASKDAQAREFQQRLDRLDRTTKTALTHQREQIDAAWNIRMREAVNLADMEAFDKAQRGKDKALKDFDAEVEEQLPAKGKDTALPREVQDFATRNDWFDVDPILTDAAVGLSRRFEARFPDMPLQERLGMVEKEMKRRFPTETGLSNHNGNGNGAAPRAAQVEGGLRPIRTTAAKGWAQLPPEAKEFANGLIKDGLFDKDPEKARAKYAAEYFAQG